ncbi:MAG: hypothetical protein JNK77_02145 [Saprospiraceae bacterium]|nr:hypothetical protein [Saprospiraceae bacterium]
MTLLRTLFWATIILSLGACRGGDSASQQADASQNAPAAQAGGVDSSQYAPDFLQQLKASDYPEKMSLQGEYLLVGTDTVYFPTQMALGKIYFFSADGGGKSYRLKVKRVNLTSLDYEFQLHRLGLPSYNESGRADLSAMFFLADEVDEDDESGEAYGAAEYSRAANGCWFNIRIGHDPDQEGHLRAEVRLGCGDKKHEAPVDDSPTLRER